MGDSYSDLIAWCKAMDLVTEIYRIPGHSREMNCTAGPISCVVPPFRCPATSPRAEPAFPARSFHHFLSLARGSLVEIETQLLIAQNLEYISPNQTRCLLDKTSELGKALNSLIAAIKSAALCGDSPVRGRAPSPVQAWAKPGRMQPRALAPVMT
jgi:hypothetical protein